MFENQLPIGNRGCERKTEDSEDATGSKNKWRVDFGNGDFLEGTTRP
jgi:hypothetical protein